MIFEMSVHNCDKGEINETNILKRIKQFESRGFNLLLTNQPLFFEKTESLKSCCFVLGYDTFIRLIDLKYYNSDEEQLK